MYRKFDVTRNILFTQYFFLEVNTAYVCLDHSLFSYQI
jgi:hypothetical protein